MSRYGHRVSDYHIGKSSPAFVSNMRRLLQVRNAKHYVTGHKSGKITASRLWRVGLPPIDGGDWNSRVFKVRSSETDLLDTAVLFLVDWSGSMSGAKSQAAAKASALVNDAFGQVLHVPLCIVAFSSCGEIPSLGIMKGFNERVSADEMALRFYDFLAHMSGNNDADSLLWAYRHILGRPEKRKIIIVASDGSPADGIGDPFHALKTVTQDILKSGLVDLYGLGIMDENVKHFYPKHVIIKRAEQLESSLVDLMGNALK